MQDFKILKLLDKFKFLFTKFGVDYPIMRNLLQVKLLMDERKTPTYFNQKKKKENKNGYIKSLWIHALIGLVLIPFMAFEDNYIFQMSIAFSIIFVMIMTTLISEFSSVLLDVRDQTILFTKPISAKTINAAKFMHVLIYLTYLSIALTGIPLIAALVNKGILFFFVTVVEIIFINIFVIVLTTLVYLFILRFFDGERLKDLINYVQIGLSLMLMIGYQVMIRTFDLVDLSMKVDFHWWNVFLIPMWFAAPYEWLFHDSRTLFTIGFTLLAIIVPIISFLIYLKLIPTFERNLQKLLSTSKSKKEKENAIKKLFLKIICSSHEERVFYRFSSLMMKNEREFKLKVYPSLGFSFIIPFIFLYNQFSMEEVDFSNSMSYLNIYFSMLIIPSAVMMLSHSSKYKAAWIYKTSPLESETPLQKGALKAFLVKLYLPLFILIFIIFCIIYGLRILPDLLAVLVSSFLFTIFCYIACGREIPFSKPINEVNDSQSWFILLLYIPLGLIVAIHYVFIQFVPFGAFSFLILMVIINFFAWKITFRNSRKLVIE